MSPIFTLRMKAGLPQGLLKKSIAANHANCANRKTIEKANRSVKNEPASGGLALFVKFAAIQGFFNSPQACTRTRRCGIVPAGRTLS